MKGAQSARRAADFHQRFRRLAGSSSGDSPRRDPRVRWPIDAVLAALRSVANAPVHDGFRGELGLLERDSKRNQHECNGIHPTRRTGRPSSADHRPRTPGVHHEDRWFTARDRASPQGAAARRPLELPGIRPASHRRSPRARRMDGRRRWESVRRLRHGLRRALLRPLPPAGAPGRRASTRQRHAVRHPVRDERRRGRAARRAIRTPDVAVHQLRHRGHDGRHSRRPRRDRSRKAREGGRRLPRSPRRGDDLDEAESGARRPG